MSQIGDLEKKLTEAKKKLPADKNLSQVDKSNLTAQIDVVLKKVKGLPERYDQIKTVLDQAKNLKSDITKYNSDQGGVKAPAQVLKTRCGTISAKSPVVDAVSSAADDLMSLTALQAP